MSSTQFTVAFHIPVDVAELYRILAQHYGEKNIEIGAGILVNGLPQDWIVVSNERRIRMD